MPSSKSAGSETCDAVSSSISAVTASSSASVRFSSASDASPDSVLLSASANESKTASNSAKISEVSSSSVSRRFRPFKIKVVALVNRTTRTVENMHCVLDLRLDSPA